MPLIEVFGSEAVHWLSYGTNPTDALQGGSTTTTGGTDLGTTYGPLIVPKPYVDISPTTAGGFANVQYSEWHDAPTPPTNFATNSLLVYCWDVRPLTAAQRAAFTSVTITVIQGLAFHNSTTPFTVGPQAHIPDLHAAVPDSVVDWSALSPWLDISTGAILAPDDIAWQPHTDPASPGYPLYFWGEPPEAVPGGQWAFPPRPFSSISWTTLSTWPATVDTDGNTLVGHPDAHLNGGTWTIPVDLDTHLRDGRLVIVLGTEAQLTGDIAGVQLSYLQSTWAIEGARWTLAPASYSQFVPLISLNLDDLGNTPRVHFRAIKRD